MKVKGSTAYQSALEHFNTGLSLVSDSIWIDDHDLAFALHKESIECEYLVGHFEEAEKKVEELQSISLVLPELVQIHLMRTTYNTMVGRFNEAIKIGISGLKLFDIDIPELPIDEDYGKEIAQITANMEGKKISDLVNLPSNETPENLLPLIQLALMFAPTYITGNIALMSLVIMKMTAIATKHGDFNGVAFSCNGLLQGAQQNYKEGYEYTLVASKIFPQAVLPFFVMGAFVGPWKISFEKCIQFLEQAYSNCIAAGDLTYARYSASFIVGYPFLMGMPLSKAMKYYSRFVGFINESGDPMMISLMNMILMVNRALTNHDNPFDSTLIDEKSNLAQEMPILHFQYYTEKSLICYLFGDYRLAYESAIEANKTIAAVTGHGRVPQRVLAFGLSATFLYFDFKEDEKESIWAEIKECQEQLKTWADNCPENFLHKYLLLTAEIERVSGEKEKAMTLFEKAIEQAKLAENLGDIALINEISARFFLSMNIQSVARMYLSEARYWYQRWGATRKVKQLEETYSDLLLKRVETFDSTSSNIPSITTSITSGTGTSQALDLGTVFKASHAISEEIVLEKLLEKLMKLLIENAGAQRGFIILDEGNQLKIKAEGSVEQKDVIKLQSTSIDDLESTDKALLSVAIVHYVKKTKEPLVLDDATHKGQFTDDSYVKANQPKSVLCAPILHQNRLSGILYLENNLTAGAFTSERLKILTLLSSQTAISLENAGLYSKLEQSEKNTVGSLKMRWKGSFKQQLMEKSLHLIRPSRKFLVMIRLS